MNIPFWKMHGAGNDFIMINALKTPLELPATTIAAWCHRRTGVGSDGLVLLYPPQDGGHFRMRFFNPDGQTASMCGNGARCAARMAAELGIAPAMMIIETEAGRLHAEWLPEHQAVRIELTPPHDCQLDSQLKLDDGTSLSYAFVNTGVPHTVIEVIDLGRTPVNALGKAIRHHARFAPAGTNVNFIYRTGPDSLSIRTFERGVEAETLACGTGIAAAAVTAVRRGRVISPVRILTRGGDRLCVRVDGDRVTLTGPAEHAFTGNLEFSPMIERSS